MHKPPPLSAFIIAQNEADRIGRTIAALRGLADDIVVVDSGSTDGTQAVAEAAGARVVFHTFAGYGPQKRFAEEQCMHHWLLNVDADEVLSDALRDEIRALFAHGTPSCAGYYLRIIDVLPGCAPSTRGHTVRAVRLYTRSEGRYAESPVHDRVQFSASARLETLRAPCWHYSSRGVTHSIEKINRYSTFQAEDMRARGRGMHFLPLKLVLIMPLAFLKAYVLRGYALQGTAGFANSVLYAFSRFARLAKLRELLAARKV